MQHIVTLTMNPAIDKCSSVEQVVSDKKLRCKPPRFEPGGGGINVGRAIKKLGGEAFNMYPAGGPPGKLYELLLDEESVKHQCIAIKNWTRQNLMIIEESSGKQYRFGMPGPELSQDEWEECLSVIGNLEKNPSFIVASGSLPPGVPDDFYARIVHLGKKQGSRVIIDTSGEPLKLAANAGAYLLKPNLRELSHIIGKTIEEETDLEDAAHQIIRECDCEVIVVSLGAGGVFMLTGEERAFIRSPTVPIKSKVGAGDSMVAGITLSLARNKTLRDSVRFGVAAGAAAVMTPGSELCRREDTERLFKQME